MKNFAEKLKKALKEKGMTQVELCEKIGMSQGGIKRMIDSGSTRVDTLEKICDILGVPITYFLDVETKEEPVGFWKRLVEEATTEAQNWKIRAYQLEEQLSKSGNFKYVSRRQGVLASVA
ncbi:helix-turn-helix domain-containing protein [Flectobacillus roseus]|uniref:Helix-turn-helix transcriptional regulator n=1 Tax=Flectobacillus roseus TaxID=502259 RepID=A0ABT6Y379_9BACT|nr:helix-turn-helix transcriptional regulator [Flectobacillus roseus]MDI9858019.1 helix-turn-helix transcriptional regulator [Flectobacillus roseus]